MSYGFKRTNSWLLANATGTFRWFWPHNQVRDSYVRHTDDAINSGDNQASWALFTHSARSAAGTKFCPKDCLEHRLDLAAVKLLAEIHVLLLNSALRGQAHVQLEYAVAMVTARDGHRRPQAPSWLESPKF
jgi:hypothetical protein